MATFDKIDDRYTEREEMRESYKKDSLRAWSAFETNGKHLTGEEADAWLARLVDGEDTDAPKSHD